MVVIRDVEFVQLLEQELYDDPLSVANMDTSLGSTNQSQLNVIFESGVVSCLTLSSTELETYTNIDGMSLVYSIGKSTSAATFGGLADVVIENVKTNFCHECTRCMPYLINT